MTTEYHQNTQIARGLSGTRNYNLVSVNFFCVLPAPTGHSTVAWVLDGLDLDAGCTCDVLDLSTVGLYDQGSMSVSKEVAGIGASEYVLGLEMTCSPLFINTVVKSQSSRMMNKSAARTCTYTCSLSGKELAHRFMPMGFTFG